MNINTTSIAIKFKFYVITGTDKETQLQNAKTLLRFIFHSFVSIR
jgi:hypothetical protein